MLPSLPIGLRAKVVILSSFLLCLPWLGYEYVWEMEKYLRLGQEQTLEGTTQALATALHERPKLFNKQASFLSQVEEGRDLYAYPLAGAIQLDGKLQDWQAYQHRMLSYGENHVIYHAQPEQALNFSFNHMVGKYGRYLYAYFEVSDDDVVYRQSNSLSVSNNDHLVIATQSPDGEFRRYIVATAQNGWVNAFSLPLDPNLNTPVTPELKIQGQWQATAKGYNIELRIPLTMVGNKLGFAIHNVNSHPKRHLHSIVGTSSTASADDLGTVLVPSPEIERIIKGMSHNSSRIWVVDKHGRVLAKSGDIRNNQGLWGRTPSREQDWLSRFSEQYLHPLYYKVLTKPPQDFVDALQDSTELSGQHIQQALSGKPASTWRLTPDEKAVILAAASPIWIDDQVMGVVIAEETTNGIRTLRNRSLEKLFNIILTVMTVGTLSLFIFASSISNRIRRLRDQAEQAIDSQGRITATFVGAKQKDEIGDLSRSFANTVSRLSQYTHYLENMSSRLSHELRTPVAVVRSSLEHLNLQAIEPEAQKYVDRAQEGVNRLNLILNNMSEATRLEQSLSHAESSPFPLNKVIAGCMQGYQYTYPEQTFDCQLLDSQVMVNGVPEYIAQLMDKLIANAMEFSPLDSPIQVKFSLQGKHALLSISNQGPSLPDNMVEQIFESMVSVRPQQAQQKPHLGLGLYIARLICEFHGGNIKAANLSDNSGVILSVSLPII